MSVMRVSTDGLWVAARQLEQYAQSITDNRGPGNVNATDQATAAVVSATHTRVAQISSILAKRIEATAGKLDEAGHRYAGIDGSAASALSE